MTDIHTLTIKEAGEQLVKRSFTAEELLDATLARINETEGKVHAFVTVMEKTARKEAQQADHDLSAGNQRGPLQGIPVGVKDLCYTHDAPTQGGSRVLEGFRPDHDATVVKLLRDGGAVILGKTHTHEFAYGQDVPPTRNAWNQDCYPGGSSAGSGVSVAVRSAFGAVGTDTGGSIRAPACVNGVVGLKPTYGRVSRHGVIPMSATLDTVGPLTRTVEDCALFLGVIAGYDPNDSGSIAETVPDYIGELEGGVKGIRLGLDREFFLSKRVAPDVRRAVEAAIRGLEGQGAEVVELRIPELDLAVAVGMPILLADTSAWHRKLLRDRGDKYVPATRVMLELGEFVLGASYVTAQRARAMLIKRISNVFQVHRLDALISPTLPVPTMPVEELSVDLTGNGDTALSAYLHHCFFANVLGLPALSVPCGFSSDDLPIGLQLVGRPFQEATLLRVARAYEAIDEWHRRAPVVRTAEGSMA